MKHVTFAIVLSTRYFHLSVRYSVVDKTPPRLEWLRSSPWASYQIHKVAGCACASNAGNVFPVTAGKESRHASRHVRHAHTKLPPFVSISEISYAFGIRFGNHFELPQLIKCKFDIAIYRRYLVESTMPNLLNFKGLFLEGASMILQNFT